MNILVLIAVSVLNYGNGVDRYYKFAPATSWTFDRVENGTRSKVVLDVLRHDGGKVFLSSKRFKPGVKKPSSVKSMVWYVEKGFLMWGQKKDKKVVPTLHALKVGAKKGDSWESPLGQLPSSFKATCQGVGPVTVPAGTYKNATHVSFHLRMLKHEFQLDLYFVPGIGMVKMVERRDKYQSTMVLAKMSKVR